MVIGDGDIARVLWKVNQPDSLVFFASGVSNSQCTDEAEYLREKTLLLAQPQYKHIVYFSSLSIYYSTGRYAAHKFEMEQLIRERFGTNSTIVRLGNITWGANPNTLINYFKEAREKRLPIEVKNVYRFLVNEAAFICAMAKVVSDRPWELNLYTERLKVVDIIRRIIEGSL